MHDWPKYGDLNACLLVSSEEALTNCSHDLNYELVSKEQWWLEGMVNIIYDLTLGCMVLASR